MIASAFPLLVVITTIVVLGVTHSLFAASPFVIALQVGAIGLSVWARRSFSKGTFRVVAAPSGPSVITRGPYRFIRHPMYSAALLFVWTAILSHLSKLNVTLGLAVVSVVVARIVAEERLLRARYPDYAGTHVPRKRSCPSSCRSQRTEPTAVRPPKGMN